MERSGEGVFSGGYGKDKFMEVNLKEGECVVWLE